MKSVAVLASASCASSAAVFGGDGGVALLAGFFEDQMKVRHQIGWYAKLGAGFYHRAAAHERSVKKARLLDAIARRFEPWRQRHSQLSRELRDQPYLLPPPSVM